MAQQAALIRDRYATDNEGPARNQGVDVISLTYSKVHNLVRSGNHVEKVMEARLDARWEARSCVNLTVRRLAKDRFGQRKIFRIGHFEIAQIALHQTRGVAEPLQRTGFVGHIETVALCAFERIAQQP